MNGKKTDRKARSKQYRDNLRVLSTTTPEKLVKAVVSGAGFIKKKGGRI